MNTRIQMATSWVIVNRTTGKAICETYSAKNRDLFAAYDHIECVPISEWLPRVNRAVKAGEAWVQS
jgi:hypothetical protein